ncbi:hypothetical protein LCGC14_0714080 [marine sediment metagenome]|uniref:Uncharacterized protein n=1 Tax=marine sediment metagenome TaxID=412755 RepID=A0A0F9QE90_9ZZZZ
MKRFSITIASIFFFLVSVGGVHGASFEISGGTESNVTTDTAQTFTADQTFNDNVKLHFGTDQDHNLVFDGSDFLISSGAGSIKLQDNTSITGTVEVGGRGKFQGGVLDGSNLALIALNAGKDIEIFPDGTEGLLIQDGGDVNLTGGTFSGDSASGGFLALVGSTHNTKGDVIVHSTSYFRFDKTNAGAPSAGDCDDDGDRGRLVIDTTNNALYVCNGGVRAWDVITLTDSADLRPTAIGFIIDGGGAVITVGEKGHVEIPYACTISRVTMLADQSGDIEVDIWKDTFGNFPPANGDSITSSTVPTISGDVAHQDTTLTNWTTSVTAGDILAYNVDTVTSITRVMVSLKCDRD